MTKFGILLRDPKKSSGTALTTFVTQMTAHYENDSEEGYDLWLNLGQDFYDWDEQSLAKVEKLTMGHLRNVLFDRKVYTPKDAKPIEKLDKEKNLPFKGTIISTSEDTLKLSQQRQCDKTNAIDTADDIKSQYVKERARVH
ncbi:hypothetical protein N7G274_007785 [Stereocaulon virgatum]|uniref:Uncharacterized protein n=1 Tax=Stereocaulon virgatum TaxID=373712 RepID=A0ABR4A392_9LECA